MEKIGVIGGTGKFGNALTHRLATYGYHVSIGSRSEEKGKKIADEMNKANNYVIQVEGGSIQSSIESQIIVLAVPPSQAIPLLEDHKQKLKGKLVWDVTVPLTFGKFIKNNFKEGKSNLEQIRNFFDESHVVGCLKTVSADLIRDTTLQSKITTFVLSKDEAYYQTTAQILENIGFFPVRVRGIYHAQTLERMTALAIQLNKTYPGSRVAYSLVGLEK